MFRLGMFWLSVFRLGVFRLRVSKARAVSQSKEKARPLSCSFHRVLLVSNTQCLKERVRGLPSRLRYSPRDPCD